MKRMASGSILLSLSLSLSLSSTCLADEFSSTSLVKDGWYFVPVLDGEDVSSVFAVRSPDEIDLYTISGLVFEINPAGEISSYAWSSTSYEAMIVYMSVHYSVDILNAVDFFPLGVDFAIVQDELDMAMSATPVIPADFEMGLFANDPFQTIIQSLENPEIVLAPLESSGYAATSSVGGTKVGPPLPNDDCTFAIADLINGIVEGAEAQVQGTAGFLDAFQASMESIQGDNCGCIPASSVETSDWETTCGPWVPSSGGIQTLANCMGRRHFNRNVDSTRTRTYTRVCANCDVLQCVQSQTRFMVDREYGPRFDMSQWACNEELVPGYVGDPPVDVACEITWFDMVFGDVTVTSWAPNGCSLEDLVCP